ncbi:MAG TPA: VOC family protein [Actinomycetota bacterium]|nr:VOC family protein [Actinomycetota bacterium]
MGLAPDTLTFDTGDPVRVATFWAAALGYDLVDPDPAGAYIADPSGQTRGIFFQPVPEPKTAKNRVHLDLRPSGTMREEVDRLRLLGATELDLVEKDASAVDGQPTFWTVMQDVEGNEFCVLRGPGDGWKPDEL